MTRVLAPARLADLLADRPCWQPRSHSLLRTMTVVERPVAMAVLDAVRGCAPGHGSASVTCELRGAELIIRIRSLGHVGLTDDALRLARDIDTVTAGVVGSGLGD